MRRGKEIVCHGVLRGLGGADLQFQIIQGNEMETVLV